LVPAGTEKIPSMESEIILSFFIDPLYLAERSEFVWRDNEKRTGYV
jgi:hypothetical protein